MQGGECWVPYVSVSLSDLFARELTRYLVANPG